MGICRFSINYICRPQVQIQSIFLPLKKIHFCCIFLFCHLFLESSRLCPITCVCRLPVSSHFESSLLCLVILNPVYCVQSFCVLSFWIQSFCVQSFWVQSFCVQSFCVNSILSSLHNRWILFKKALYYLAVCVSMVRKPASNSCSRAIFRQVAGTWIWVSSRGQQQQVAC